jgi:acetoin utilization deacetylase AcuC-like enzyme
MTDLPVYYSSDYTLAGHAFDTTRKAAWVADSLRHRPIPGVRLLEPEPLTQAQFEVVHDPDYVEAVRTGNPIQLAESQDFDWDPGLWKMVSATNGGAVAAALAALESKQIAGSLSSGLHHAKRDHGDGFCTFNGLALAARAAQAAGAPRILVIDLDAHCGGGTTELLGGDVGFHQLDVAVNSYDRYTVPAGWTFDLVGHADDYLPTIRRRLDDLTRESLRFDLVLYNAGMDPFEGSAVGGLDGITAQILAERERLIFSWCRRHHLPVAFVLAGGYAHGAAGQADLVELHRSTIGAAASS